MLKKIIFLFISTISFSQNHTITGVVFDENQKPLESANIIAKPIQDEEGLKFAITDNYGRYKLELDNSLAYEISVSYIGYSDEILIVEKNSKVITHNFSLKSTGEELKEIIIKHDFTPIIVKKDTIIYNVKSFTNGNEQKLKEQLEKLPGVEVDKNGGVTVQGKKVTKFLVEGDSFFGGGTKLGVENIPANVVDKVEVIDHFNEVGFMKQVSDSEDLAMNIKLKGDKKKFVFGDIEAGAEVANDNGFYLSHTGLFYYSPKSNISFIGDLNNIGKSIFTFEDLIRFEGGASSFLNNRKSLTNLYSFANDNTDLAQNKSQFGALNFSFDTSSKLILSGFGIFSKVFMQSKTENENEYLQNDNNVIFENKLLNSNNRTLLGIANIKLDYSPNKDEKLFYNIHFQSSSNDLSTVINSITNLGANNFETINNADNVALKQYIEWHKRINDQHNTTFVINQVYEKDTPKIRWLTDQTFLAGLIPLQNDLGYTIDQFKKVNNNSIDILFKHYWIINNSNHIYSNVGNNFISSSYTTTEKQLLSNGSINDFSNAGFGNDIKYKLNDSYIGFEYKFRIGNWSNKPALYLHLYHLSTNDSNAINKTLFQPQFNSEYEFNKSELINFSYKLSNTFPEVKQYGNQYTLQTYNSVFKGNALLQNEQFHTANLRYSKMNMFRGIILNANVSYNKKVKAIRNIVEFSGINQYSTPILTYNPETNWRLNGFISKKIYHFNIKLNSSFNSFDYVQNINSETIKSKRTNTNIGLMVKTAHKKLPDFSISYNKGFSEFIGLTKSNYKSDEFKTEIEFTFFKFFAFEFDYENFKNTNSNNQSNYYDIANISLRYQKKNSPLSYELFANNLFDNNVKNDYSFSDYIISESATYILPRIFMLSISYKL